MGSDARLLAGSLWFSADIVETAPQLRTGGYVIDFWGTGFDVADRMGLLPEIQSRGYMVEEVRIVNRRGKKVAGISGSRIFQVGAEPLYQPSPRDLAVSIFGRIEGKVETIFGDTVARIEQLEQSVRVTFERGIERDFDLVVGADGLHLRVRELIFGEQSRFENYLGMKAAAFEVAWLPAERRTGLRDVHRSRSAGGPVCDAR